MSEVAMRGGLQASLAAWESSYFAALSTDARNAMLRDAFVINVQAGGTINEPSGPPRLFLLHSGQARVTVASKEGRAVTVRYAGPGQVLGLPSAIADSSPIGAHAISD